jgi:hypothetical protein
VEIQAVVDVEDLAWEASANLLFRSRLDEHNSKFSLSMKPKFNRPVGERNNF